MEKANKLNHDSLLTVRNLSVSYRTFRGYLRAVENVDLALGKGRTYALVGESGCGKSTLGLALSRLLPENRVTYSGKIVYDGIDLLALREEEVEKYRGTHVATIFQEPMTCLNPVYRVGEQIAEAISVRERRKTTNDESDKWNSRPASPKSSSANHNTPRPTRSKGLYQQFSDEIQELLRKVKIAHPERVANMFPHELSGGMRQRIMIAAAVAEKPSLLVADEPTTALDVTTQMQILKLIRSLTDEYGMSVLLIAHDLGVVSAVADYVSVMYAGRIVEEAPASELFREPLHPYTVGLLGSFPKGRKDRITLKTIAGTVPQLGRYPTGCRFHPRCEKAFKKCPNHMPELIQISKDHKVSCFLFEGCP